MRIRKSLLIAALLVSIPVLARAQGASRSWTAAQGVLPADVTVVAGMNMSSVRKSQLFTTLFPALMSSEPEARQALDTIKASCGIDAVNVVNDLVIAMDKSEKGAIYLGLAAGVDEKKVTSCLVTVGAKLANAKITAKRTGNIVEYAEAGSKDKIYAGWIGSDVLVIALDPENKALLERMMGGKGVKTGEIARGVKAVNTGAAFWAAVVEKDSIGTATMKGGYGAVDLAGGLLTLDGHLIVGSAKEAAAAAAEANKQMAAASGSMGPDMDKILKAVKITSSGDELVFKMSISEKDVMSLMGMLMAGGGF